MGWQNETIFTIMVMRVERLSHSSTGRGRPRLPFKGKWRGVEEGVVLNVRQEFRGTQAGAKGLGGKCYEGK